MTLGIHTLEQIQIHGDFKTFDQLQSDLGLPPRAIFQYLRLKHVYMKYTTVHGNYVLERILKSQFTKGLIYCAYRGLLIAKIQDCPLPVRLKWEEKVGPLTDDQWNALLELTPQLPLAAILTAQGI